MNMKKFIRTATRCCYMEAQLSFHVQLGVSLARNSRIGTDTTAYPNPKGYFAAHCAR